MRVGLTFNLKHGETEDTPEPSGTGSFEIHVKYDVVETVKTAGGMVVLPQKAYSRSLLMLVGGLFGPCSEGSLPSIREHLNIQYIGSGFWTLQHLMKAQDVSLEMPVLMGPEGIHSGRMVQRPAAVNRR